MSDIRMTAKVAYDLVKQAASLFYDGTGIPLQPSDELIVLDHNPTFLEDLEEGSDIRYWANQLLFFARTVHGILETALIQDAESMEISDEI